MEFNFVPLLHSITRKELEEMQALRGMHRRSYQKGEIIFHAGSIAREMGLVLSGSVHIENVDLWGNRSILQAVPAGQMFAETYVLCREPLMVDVVCAEDVQALLVDMAALLREENRQKTWYLKLYHNLLMGSFRKNLALSNRIFCTAPKSVRGRVLSYLSYHSLRAGSADFTIPFDRQQMADYLNLERSALSKELGKMRKEGILDFRKNHFVLKRELVSGA